MAFARVTLPFKPGLRILLAAPALIPSYVMGLAWLSLAQSPWMSSLPSAVTVLTVALYPLLTARGLTAGFIAGGQLSLLPNAGLAPLGPGDLIGLAGQQATEVGASVARFSADHRVACSGASPLH